MNAVSATMNGETAEVITAGLVQNQYGIYNIQMVVPSDLPANSTTQLYVAQNAFISNTVTIPVGAPGTYTPYVPPGAGLSTAQVIVSPTTLVLNGATGSPNRSGTVTVSNPNNAALNIGNVSIQGPNASAFNYTTTCQGSIAQNCTITVGYAPSSAGMSTATLVITDNVSGSSQSVSLIGVTGEQYEIVNNLSGRVLDVVGASTSNGAPVDQYDYLGGNQQQWTLVPVGPGNFSTGPSAFAIMNVNSGKVLDVTGGSTNAATPLQQWDYLGTPNQQWTFQPAANGFYVIVNVGSGLALDDTGYSLSNGTVLQQYYSTGNTNQQWALLPTVTYTIVNLNSGLALDDTGYSTTDGTVMQQWYPTGNTNQQWQLIPIDGTYYEIKNVLSGKVLDVTGSSAANGTLIQQWDYVGGDNQKWALVPTDVPGTYQIVNKLSGRVLDVIASSTQGATQIQQWDFLDGANQKWQLVVNH
jgi:hypothetical protein